MQDTSTQTQSEVEADQDNDVITTDHSTLTNATSAVVYLPDSVTDIPDRQQSSPTISHLHHSNADELFSAPFSTDAQEGQGRGHLFTASTVNRRIHHKTPGAPATGANTSSKLYRKPVLSLDLRREVTHMSCLELRPLDLLQLTKDLYGKKAHSGNTSTVAKLGYPLHTATTATTYGAATAASSGGLLLPAVGGRINTKSEFDAHSPKSESVSLDISADLSSAKDGNNEHLINKILSEYQTSQELTKFSFEKIPTAKKRTTSKVTTLHPSAIGSSESRDVRHKSNWPTMSGKKSRGPSSSSSSLADSQALPSARSISEYLKIDIEKPAGKSKPTFNRSKTTPKYRRSEYKVSIFDTAEELDLKRPFQNGFRFSRSRHRMKNYFTATILPELLTPNTVKMKLI